MDTVPGIQRILEVARAEGVPYDLVPHWETRGSGQFVAIDTALDHHDAFPARTGPFGGLRTCTFGREDLRNSLCMFYLGSDDVAGHDDRRWSTFYVVAALVSWHAGKGHITTNPRSRGIEARNDGVGEPWPAQQLRTYVFLDAMAAIVWGAETYDHKEHSSTGKVDRNLIDPDAWRREVEVERRRLLAAYPALSDGGPIVAPITSTPTTTFEEPTMMIWTEPVPSRAGVFAVDHTAGHRRRLFRPELDDIIRRGGVRHQDPNAKPGWKPPVAGSWLYDLAVVEPAKKAKGA